MIEKGKRFLKGFLLSISALAFYLIIMFGISLAVSSFVMVYFAAFRPEVDTDAVISLIEALVSILFVASSFLTILLLYIFFRVRKRSLKEYIQLKKLSVDSLLVSLMIGSALNIVTGVLMEWIPIPLSWQEAHQESVDIGGPILIVMLVILICAPILEEIIFRGLVYRTMKDHGPTWFAIVFSSLTFGLVHGNFLQAIYAGLMGIVCVYAFEMTGSLLASIFVHFGFNAGNFLLYISGIKKWPLLAQFFIGVFIYLVGSYYLYRFYKIRLSLKEGEESLT